MQSAAAMLPMIVLYIPVSGYHAGRDALGCKRRHCVMTFSGTAAMEFDKI